MGKLTQVTILAMLRTMIQDEGFLESLVDCIKRIFDISPPNLITNDPFEIVVDRIMGYFEIHPEIQKVEIPGIRSTLIGMLKEKQFLAFARILRMLKDLSNYPDARIINYLKQIKFRRGIEGESISPWIDVQSTTEAVIRELDPEKMWIFAGLSREERCLLQGFTSEQIAVMSKFSPRGIVILSELGRRHTISGLNHLSVEDRREYSNLSPKEVDILNNLTDDHREVVSKFGDLNEILNVAKNLHSSQRYLILSLRREEIHALLEKGFGGDFHQLMLRYSPMIIQRSCPLPIVEQGAVLILNKQQRSVLAQAYALGHDGLFMIRKLGPELTGRVLNGEKGLNVMQTALMRKLANVNFDKNIIPQLFEIMEHKYQAILFDLSWKGVQLLSKTAELDEEMIEIVRRLSDNGMEVLMNNDRLTGTEILMLGNLAGSEGKVLMNLDVEQRHYLSKRPDSTEFPPGMFDPEQLRKLRSLSSEAKSVLERIVVLSDDEHLLLKSLQNLDTAVLTTMLPLELNLLASLTFEKLHLLSSFMFRRFEEDVIFGFLRIPLGASYADKIGRTREILRRISEPRLPANHHDYVPLIAGAIALLRLNGVVTDNYVEEILPLLEGFSFNVNLLKFSVRDHTSLVPQLTSRIEATERGIMMIRTIEDLMFIRWILSSSSIMNKRGLFEIGRGSLINLSRNLDDGHKLEALISESTSQLDGIEHKTLMENFLRMLRADRHLLSSFLFFTIGRKTNSQHGSLQVNKLFTENFDADECFQFLNDQAYGGFLHGVPDGDLPNMVSDGRFPNPTILEVSLYYNRGNVLALTEKLDEGQLWKLLENRPLLLLQMMTRNVQLDLIDLFGRVAKVKQVWGRNREGIFQSLIRELTQNGPDFTSEMYLRMARLIRRLTYWPSFLGIDSYVTNISEYTQLVRSWVSRRTLGDILNSFVNEDVSHEQLATAIGQRLGNELVISLRNPGRRSCNVLRKKREAGALCVDSENTKDLTPEAKGRIVQSTFDDTQSTLYDELLNYSERKFQGEELDPQVKRDLMARIKDIPLDSLDPRIKDIVATLHDPQKFDMILKQSGMLNKIEKVVGTTGIVFTLFFVGKHIAHGDAEGLGYDALNLWILPKIGEKITEALEKSNPVIGSVIGTTVSNLAAFLGLFDSITAREHAGAEVDQEIADLNIVTNAVFIAANIPAVATQILTEFEVETVVLGEVSGPVGVALTVSIVIGSYLIGVGLEVEKVTDHIQLSLWEKLSLYWGFFRDQPVPEEFEIDILAKNMYTEYISDHLSRLNGTYDNIAVSLPSFLITERECVLELTSGCKNTSLVLDFSRTVRARYPFSTRHAYSRIIPENIGGYDFVCGPSTRDAIEKILPENLGQVKELFIPSRPNDDCRNIVSFRKHGSLNSSKTFFYVASDASIEMSNDDSLDIVFHGRNIRIVETGGPYRYVSVNRYYFLYQPDGCSIYRKGYNFFYVTGETFECDVLGQYNTIVIKSDFKDSIGIHSIVGSDRRENIQVNYAEFVDGNGGGDVIRATWNTIVKGYANDLIIGDCAVILPFNLSDIAKLVANTRTIISNRDGSSIEVDGNARIMTADYYLLTPIRTSGIGHRMVRGHIRKTFKHRISIEEELPVLRNLTIPNCKLVKQITSANYDIVLSDLGKNVFGLDKNAHEYYWEAAVEPGNLYIFKKMFAKVVISNASGILDFKELEIDSILDKVIYRWSPEGEFKINIGGLNVSLLPEYGSVRLTFDGKKYFKVGTSEIQRDWCSHGFQIVGRVVINGTDLHNQYNCFEFQSDMIFFLRLQGDLLLLAEKQVLSISKYFSHLHGEIELSLKLGDGRIIEAPTFKERADRAHRVIYYDVGGSGLQIYHNQPVDKHHIGYVDLGHRSIKDVRMTTDSGSLLLLYRNSTLVRIENWDNYSPARDMVFVFKDSFLPNVECIFSDCDPEDIIDEFKRSATSGASRGSSWIDVIISPIRNYYSTLSLPGPSPNTINHKFSTDLCITSNVNLVLVLLQNFVDRISQLPKLPTIGNVEMLANVINLTEEYDRVSLPQHNYDPFQLYSDILELVRNERYDSIQKVLHTKRE